MRTELALAAGVLVLLVPAPGVAQGEGGWASALALDPLQWQFGNYDVRVGGFAGGTLFSAAQDGGPGFESGYENTGASALATSNIRVQRTFDTGLVFGARGDFLIYRDELSTDPYDNDTVQKAHVFVQTGFGRLELGQQDGAAYTLGLTGPLVDQQVTLENRNISLFRDPVTGEDFGRFFRQITAVQSSSNYAKINYVSPRLLGIQIGASFTPQTVRSPLPFTGNPSDAANQQHSIWEVAGSYTGFLGGLAIGVSAGFAHGRLKNRTDGYDDLYDWAIGTQLAYSFAETKLSFGGAYRGTNAFLLDIEQVQSNSRSRMVQLSTTLVRRLWVLGAEFSRADIEGPEDFGLTGVQLSAGYKINGNMQLTAGWQHYHYSRNATVFYNGLPKIGMDAAFIALGYTL
jgi:hypothetical protein